MKTLPLTEVFLNDTIGEKESLQRIFEANGDNNTIGWDSSFLHSFNKTFALHAFFIEHDLQKAKQHFWVCGLLFVYRHLLHNPRRIDAGVEDITFALLADDNLMIQKTSTLTHQHFDYIISQGSLVHAIQNIIKADWEALNRDIDIYERIVQLKKGKINIPDLLFFKGILHKSVADMTEAILLLLKDHKKRNKYMGIGQEYISIPALTYTKLAWRHGFQLDIQHPFIPQALLPVQPLPQYTIPYDFLRSWAGQLGI